LFGAEVARQEGINRRLMTGGGGDTPYDLHRELGELMAAKVGVVRDNRELDAADAGLQDLLARFDRLNLGESSTWANQSLAYARQVFDMAQLARVIARGARTRDECRGAHHKPEFALPLPADKRSGDPEYTAYTERWKANNDRWLKTTIAEHGPDGPSIRYEDVDTSVLSPEQPRDYR
jgi:succinate dehydrogenase / fumarate reductase flavoprotein subunit